MPSHCAVQGCRTTRVKGSAVLYHRFPKDEKLKSKWISFCRRNDFFNPDNSFICSCHFEKSAYQRNLKYELLGIPEPPSVKKFNPGAVPTLRPAAECAQRGPLPPYPGPGPRRRVREAKEAATQTSVCASRPCVSAPPVKVLKLPQPASPPRDIEVVEVKEEPTCREEEPTCTEEDPEVLPLQEHDPLAIKPEPVPWQPSGSQEEPQPQESHAVCLKEEIDIKEEDINSFNTEDVPLSNSEKRKRKHLCLPITQKVRLLKKLDSGVSVKRLTEEFAVGTTTICDLKKQDKLLKLYSESDEQKLMKNRKTLHGAKNEDLDGVLVEWLRQRGSEHFPLSGRLIMKQAKIYHQELNIEGSCEYSAGWLQTFKKRLGIKHFKVSGDKASADDEAAEKFIDEFGKLIAGGESEGLHMSGEKKVMSHLLTYAKSVPSESISKLEEEDMEEVFNIANDAPVVPSVSAGEIAGMVLNEGGPDDDSGHEGDIVSTEGKVSIDNMLTMCDGLIKGLEQQAFITKQDIMSVYKIKERLLRQHSLLMGQMALQEASKEAIHHSASSSPEHLPPGPSPAPDVPVLLMMCPLPQVS